MDKRKKNYRNFIQSVNWGTVPSSRQSFEDRQNLLRELVVKHIKTTPTGVLKYDDFYTTLISQLISLEKLLQHQDYMVLHSDHLTISDLVVFMVVQGLLDENLEESSIIKNDFPSIMKWYSKIDIQTKKIHI